MELTPATTEEQDGLAQIGAFEITMATIEDMKTEAASLEISGLEDKEGYKKVHDARMIFVSKIRAVEERRLDIVRDNLKKNKDTSTAAKTLTTALTEGRDLLQAKQDVIDAEKERRRQEAFKIEQERLAQERQAEINRQVEEQRLKDAIALEARRKEMEEAEKERVRKAEETRQIEVAILAAKEAEFKRLEVERMRQEEVMAEKLKAQNEALEKAERELQKLREQVEEEKKAKQLKGEAEASVNNFIDSVGKPGFQTHEEEVFNDEEALIKEEPSDDDQVAEPLIAIADDKEFTLSQIIDGSNKSLIESDITKMLHRFKLIVGNVEDMETLSTIEANTLWNQLSNEVITHAHKSMYKINIL